MITDILHLLHIIVCIYPIVLLVLPKQYIQGKRFKKAFLFSILLFSLVPLHWVMLDNQCILSLFSDSSDNRFVDKLTFLQTLNQYTFQFEKNVKDKFIALYWIINLCILWYVCFFKIFRCL